MTLTFRKEQWVKYREREGQVIRIPNLQEAHLRDRNGELFTAPIHDLRPLHPGGAEQDRRGRPVDADSAREAQAEATFRLEAISPLLALSPARTRPEVERRAEEVQCGVTTLYRWIRQYEKAGGISGLRREVRSDYGKRRMPEGLELMMESVIDKVYLQEERPTMSSTYVKLLLAIDTANKTRAEGTSVLPVPDFQTFRRRIYGVEERRRINRRYGERVARNLDPVLGHYPGADYPLAVVQIDHTLLDVILVDSIQRQPLGRAWLTLAIDVFSRVVTGFYISLDPPSAFSAGQALAHAILPKDLWLARHREALKRVVKDLDVDMQELEWPVWGMPVKLKADNAREFDGEMLKGVCALYNIDQEFRPVLNPRYGGHIERLNGTMSTDLHTLPGTTFSSPGARGDYDSEGRALMTMEALEVWLTAYFLGAYHNRIHGALGMKPLKRWEQGLLEGTELYPPTGMKDRIGGDAADRLRADLRPFFMATVQRDGVKHDGLTYMGKELRQYVLAKDSERPGSSREFLFRYDPRDVSRIFFLDPDQDRYVEIRCRQPNFPSISVWELRATKRYAKKQRLRADDDRSILAAYRMMAAVVEAEAATTKEVRRTAEKRRQRDRSREQEQAPPGGRSKLQVRVPTLNLFDDDDDVLPFDDIKL